MNSQNDLLSWGTVNNVVPIVASAIMIAMTFWSLKSDVRVLTERVDTMITQQNKILAKYEDLERRWGELSLKVNTLEVKGPR